MYADRRDNHISNVYRKSRSSDSLNVVGHRADLKKAHSCVIPCNLSHYASKSADGVTSVGECGKKNKKIRGLIFHVFCQKLSYRRFVLNLGYKFLSWSESAVTKMTDTITFP